MSRLIAFTGACLIIASGLLFAKTHGSLNISANMNMQEVQISQYLDVVESLNAIEKEDFLEPTIIASGHTTVVDVLKRMPEIQLLIEHQNVSLPLMRSRYREQEATMPDAVRLVYFIVFGLTQDLEMTDDIISYLKRCRGLSQDVLLSPWHPYLHGLRTLSKFTNGEVQAPSDFAPVSELDKFLDQFEKWKKLHSRLISLYSR
jgi:hypothetical protein